MKLEYVAELIQAFIKEMKRLGYSEGYIGKQLALIFHVAYQLLGEEDK